MASKLEQEGVAVTPLSFLRVMSAVSKAAAARLDVTPLPPAVPPPHLLHQLEILVCDSSTLKFRPCELALALLCTEFQQLCAKHPANTTALMGFVTELQKYCNIQAGHFVTVLSEVVAILELYHAEVEVPHRQRLVWKLSNRTLRHLRPTDRLRFTLPKIWEEARSGSKDCKGKGKGKVKAEGKGKGKGKGRDCQLRLRSASECSLESESSDYDPGDKAGGSDTESDVEMEESRW